MTAAYISTFLETPPVRMELRQMKAKKPDQFNLYLIALERFKNVDERKPLSFFKIAGLNSHVLSQYKLLRMPSQAFTVFRMRYGRMEAGIRCRS